MATKKTIFVAFAIEDERQRDFLKGQSLNTNSPFEYVDMSLTSSPDFRRGRMSNPPVPYTAFPHHPEQRSVCGTRTMLLPPE